jgi:hypothetical protein
MNSQTFAGSFLKTLLAWRQPPNLLNRTLRTIRSSDNGFHRQGNSACHVFQNVPVQKHQLMVFVPPFPFVHIDTKVVTATVRCLADKTRRVNGQPHSYLDCVSKATGCSFYFSCSCQALVEALAQLQLSLPASRCKGRTIGRSVLGGWASFLMQSCL